MNEKKRKISELKKYAREAMIGHYGLLVGTAVITLLLTMISSLLTAQLFSGTTVFDTILMYLTTFIFALLINLLNAGYLRIAMSCLRGGQPNLGDLLYAFRHHSDSFLLMYLVLNGISFLITIPIDLVTQHLAQQYTASLQTIDLTTSLTILEYSALGSLAGAVLSFLLLLPFSVSGFLMLDQPGLSPLRALKASAQLMKRNKLRYLYLILSFFGVYLLGAASCGIGYLWIIPYIQMTQAAFYLDLKKEL